MTYKEFISEWKSASDFIIARTSGSTGQPKEIRLPKTLLRDSARRTIDFFRLNSDSRLHSCISPDFIGGKMMAVRADVCGCNLTWEQPSNTPSLNVISFPDDLGKGHGETLISVVPSQMWHILTLPQACSFRYLIGGAHIPATLRNAIVEVGVQCWESYGMTETASHIALRKVTKEETGFTPLPGIKLLQGEDNNLIIVLNDAMTPIVTNDIAIFDSDGTFKIAGRTDNIINTGGKKVIPENVERHLSPVLSRYGIKDCLVTSRPDDKWGNRIVLAVEGSGDEIPDLNELKPHMQKILAPYEIPKEIIAVEKIPRTPNGKILRTFN